MPKLEDVLKTKYKNCFTTLKSTSYDKEHDLYMCKSYKKVIDFDRLTREIFPINHPSSYDALWSNEDLEQIYGVEFKNQDKSGVKNKKIQKKAKDSKITLEIIANKHEIVLQNYKLIYCVVYKSNPNKKEYQTRFDTNGIHFELKQFKGLYFDEVITNNIDYFTELFVQQINKIKDKI